MSSSGTPKTEVSLVIRFTEILLLALVYVATAKIGQTLAISPGNVTPVWIPSGIMLAAVLFIGSRVWPGIFLGAFFGNTWAYSDGANGELAATLIAGISNGLGDTLCFLVGARLIIHFAGTNFPFENSRHVAFFILYGALLGSTISALFGATSLSLVDIIPWSQYSDVLITWWVGDAVGILLITPFLLYWAMRKNSIRLSGETILYTLTLLVVGAYSLGLVTTGIHIPLPLSILITVIMWSIFRLGPHTTHSTVLLIGAISLVATALGFGRFAINNLNDSLIELQIFLSMLSITSMIIHSVLYERQLAEQNLLEANLSLEDKVQQRTQELATLATTDPLTGIHNRRSIVELIDLEIKRSSRHQTHFSVLMLDLDNFKSINDQLGHDIGDKVLQEACKVWQGELRDIDFLGRLGGEEFIIILPATNCNDGKIIAERIRACTELDAALEQTATMRVTVSIGVTNSVEGDTVYTILKRADQAMYRSKDNGRNRVSCMFLPDSQ